MKGVPRLRHSRRFTKPRPFRGHVAAEPARGELPRWAFPDPRTAPYHTDCSCRLWVQKRSLARQIDRNTGNAPHCLGAGPPKARSARLAGRRDVNRHRLLARRRQAFGDSVKPVENAGFVIDLRDLHGPAAWAGHLGAVDHHAANARQQRERLQPVVLFDA